jgi:hypothetical protein
VKRKTIAIDPSPEPTYNSVLGDVVHLVDADIDENLAAKCPYQRAYLPVNRLEDGTMTNW